MTGLWVQVPRNYEKMCAHREPVPTLVPKYKVSTFYSGTSSVPEFWHGYLRKSVFILVPIE